MEATGKWASELATDEGGAWAARGRIHGNGRVTQAMREMTKDCDDRDPFQAQLDHLKRTTFDKLCGAPRAYNFRVLVPFVRNSFRVHPACAARQSIR